MKSPLVLVLATFLPLSACRARPLAPLALEVTVLASRTIAVRGDTVTFRVNAQGGTLLGIEADFGDGTIERFATQGARTAQATFRHAFDAAGTFVVRATATDASAGAKTATVQVVVQ